MRKPINIIKKIVAVFLSVFVVVVSSTVHRY
jgi:hypothetical protein